MLESFFNEIKILSYCRHPNIVRLLDASFNGTLIKESLLLGDKAQVKEDNDQDQEPVVEQTVVQRRKTKICYCVLKLVRYGELF